MSPDDQHDIDPVLADAVRRAYVRPVDDVTARRHVSAMVAAAATAAGEATVARSPRRRRVWRPILAAGATTLLAPVGLAVAEVSLPDIVNEPFRAVGITLPHQTAPAPAPPSDGQDDRPPPAARQDLDRGRRPTTSGRPPERRDGRRGSSSDADPVRKEAPAVPRGRQGPQGRQGTSSTRQRRRATPPGRR